MALLSKNLLSSHEAADAIGPIVTPQTPVAAIDPTVAVVDLLPTDIPQFAIPLRLPPVVRASVEPNMVVAPLQQQVLPTGFPSTSIFGMGVAGDQSSFGWPGPTLMSEQNKSNLITWTNGLVDGSGNYVPHIMPVDPTLHWANPGGGVSGRDSRPTATDTSAYTGPVPTVIHLHGAHTTADSDGYPEAWYLPNAANIPGSFARVGTWYDKFRREAKKRTKRDWSAGSSTYEYRNDQPPAMLWYHDHALGLTRANVWAGMAGMWIIRGGKGSIETTAAMPKDAYELPLLVQDRSFRSDGSLAYPASRAEFDGYTGPVTGDGSDSDVAPIWNPEVFGNVMCVNGRTWPVHNAEARRYRLRLVNGCDSRTLILRFANDLPMWQIGNEGGFLPAPVQMGRLVMMPGQRADIVVDFSRVAGASVTMINEGPDEPFDGDLAAITPADPATTGQVMRFDIGVALTPGVDRSSDPSKLALPKIAPMAKVDRTRTVILAEYVSTKYNADGSAFDPATPDAAAGPICVLLGVPDAAGNPLGLLWDAPVTEQVKVGDTEEWIILNYTADAHPIHLHQTQFEILGRGIDGLELPAPHEGGRTDVVIAKPGERTRIRARFDIVGRFVWHCHILEHEDNEMMRPIVVGDEKNAPVAAASSSAICVIPGTPPATGGGRKPKKPKQ
jgi:spore coat protein A, manganese oxidase